MPDPLTLSYTSYRLYDDCPRQWLYQRATHRLPGAPLWHLIAQGACAPAATFVGGIVDAALTHALLHFREHRAWPADIPDYAHRTTLDSWQFSLDWVNARLRREPWPKSDRNFRPLDRHLYQDGFTPEEKADIRARIRLCIENFEASDIRRFIESTDPHAWLGPRAPGEPIPNFDLDGVTVWAAPDFALRHEGRLYVIDWKTGRSDGYAYSAAIRQLHWYALHAVHAWDTSPEAITLVPVFLAPAAQHEEHPVAADDLAELTEAIHLRHRLLTERLAPEVPFPLREEEWELAQRQGLCRACVFRGGCEGARRGATQAAG
jgi:hypothetical protein